MWRRIEEGNMATSVLDEFIFDQDVMLPAPPQTSWDFTEASGIANTVGVRTVETGLNRHNRPSPKIISSECLHIDHFSKWAEAVSIPNHTAATVAKALMVNFDIILHTQRCP